MENLLHFIPLTLSSTWDLFLDASPYVLFGILVAGLLRVFLSPDDIVRKLGKGRLRPVIRASLLGSPLPLCSCGVLPTAASLRRQGASKGATMAFLISTPETGVDSIAISWALLDPILTVARPVVAFMTSFLAGLAQNLLGGPEELPGAGGIEPTGPVDGCCEQTDCEAARFAGHHSLNNRILEGVHYAFGELWGDLAGWFFAGMILAGLITALVPGDLVTLALGGGIGAMLFMLVMGIPLYICATASTPIAAALILKGVSPGAALVFLLAGPATNLAGLTVLIGLLGKRSVAIYLGTISLVSILAGLVLDQIYLLSGISADAVAGQAGKIIPLPVQYASGALLLGISVRPILASTAGLIRKLKTPGRERFSSECDCGNKGDKK